MDSKLHSIIISSILAFALIAGIPAAFVSVLAQGEDGDTGGMTAGTGNATGLTGGAGATTQDTDGEGGDEDEDEDEDEGREDNN